MRRALSLILIAGLALAGLPALAQDFGPNTIWGEVPAGVAGNAANAVLQDTGGRVVATVPVIDGKFAFLNVAPGEYVVVVQDGAGEAARHEPRHLLRERGHRRRRSSTRPASRPRPSPRRGGLGTTGWILIGAAAVGITTAIVHRDRRRRGRREPEPLDRWHAADP